MSCRPLEQGDAGLAAGSAATSDLLSSAAPSVFGLLRARLADYCALGKLRIAAMVLLVTAAGFCMAGPGPADLGLLLHTLLGTGLVAFSANALNQWLERDLDARMERTRDRPIPAGRISPHEALALGAATALFGLGHLALAVNALSAIVAALTIGLYLLAYTPAKRWTVYNTWIGAVPGALPPVIGGAAAAGTVTGPVWLLFAILFVWQLPHFFAIAWMYRADYAAGGYRMLSVVDPTGAATARQTVATTVVLLLVGLAPAALGYVRPAAAIGAAALGLALLAVSLRMALRLTDAHARWMLLASVIHLPALMALMLLGRSAP
jgi:protoheme IX farnesyltransferase